MTETAEPSAPRGRLFSSRFNDENDPHRRARLAFAFACSFALVEIAAGFFPGKLQPKPEDTSPTQIVTIVQRTPAPTPRPTPVPTPRRTPQPVVTFAPHPTKAVEAAKAAAPVRLHVGGRASARVRHVTPPHVVHATPRAVALAKNNGAGVNNGGQGTGAGSGTGNGGLGGTGSGTGDSGSGTGGGVAPCGVVVFTPKQVTINHDGSRTMTIELEVTLSDRSVQSDALGWKWYYRTESLDPFSPRNKDGQVPTTLQFPPAGYDVAANQKPITQYVIKHTRADGWTDLLDCPQ